MRVAGLAAGVLGPLTALLVPLYLWHRNARRRQWRAYALPQDVVRAAIDAANEAYLAALRSGDAAGYAAVFAPSGVSLPADGKILRGRDAIERAMATAFAKARYLDGSLKTVELVVIDDLAYEVGDYRVEYTRRGNWHATGGRYLAVWQCIDDEWKLAAEASQPGAPSAAA